ncbi:MAG TPA: polymer-forming cytoskeletal protein [Vicinamibacteria bacterium]|jgi:cytoskeletal protein CcmA (bactofilin family)
MRIPGSVADTPPATGGRESTLSADLNVTGTISGQDLDVLGQFEGELRLAGKLRTGGASRVKAVVKAKAVEIEGEFEGEVRAESLRLAPTARARGTFVAKRLVIEEGAVFHGAVNREPPATATPEGPALLPGVTTTPSVEETLTASAAV